MILEDGQEESMMDADCKPVSPMTSNKGEKKWECFLFLTRMKNVSVVCEFALVPS